LRSTPVGCGTLLPVIKGASGTNSQPSGSLCTFRRCITGLAQGCHCALREQEARRVP
jgi:hypothetical protein